VGCNGKSKLVWRIPEEECTSEEVLGGCEKYSQYTTSNIGDIARWILASISNHQGGGRPISKRWTTA